MRLTPCVAAVLIAMPCALEAQPRFSVGALTGSYHCWQSFSCDSREAAEARNAPGGFIGVRVPLDDRVAAGLDVSHRWKDHGYRTTQLTMVGGQLLLRPTPLDGFWLRGGFAMGVGRQSGFRIDDMIIGPTTSTDPITTIGALHDVRLGDRVWLTPQATLGWFRNGEQRLWDVGLALSWRPAAR
jgi:hypothetical protein